MNEETMIHRYVKRTIWAPSGSARKGRILAISSSSKMFEGRASLEIAYWTFGPTYDAPIKGQYLTSGVYGQKRITHEMIEVYQSHAEDKWPPFAFHFFPVHQERFRSHFAAGLALPA